MYIHVHELYIHQLLSTSKFKTFLGKETRWNKQGQHRMQSADHDEGVLKYTHPVAQQSEC